MSRKTIANLPRALAVAGDAPGFRELVAAYGAACGKRLQVEALGSRESLNTRADELRRRGRGDSRFVRRSTLNGEGALGPLRNDLFREIRPKSVRDYIKQEEL